MIRSQTTQIQEYTQIILMTAYFIAFIIQYASIFDFYLNDITRYSRGFQAMIVLYFMAISFLRGRIVGIGGIVAITLLAAFHISFTVFSGSAANFNTLFSYVTLIAFVPLVECDLSYRKMTRILFWLCVVYASIYVAANGQLTAITSGSREALNGVLDSGDERGTRVFLAALCVSFATFYAIEDDKLSPLARIYAVLIAGTAAVLSNSRVFMAMFAFVVLLRILRWNTRPVMIALLLLFVSICCIYLWGLVDPRWNPYLFVAGDKSGAGRYIQYPQAIRAFWDHFPIGVGIEPDPVAMAEHLRVPRRWGSVFFGDLSIIGPLAQFGLIGIIVFLVASIASILSGSKRSKEPGLNAVRLTCVVSALFGMLGPSIITPPAAFFTMMLFAGWLRRRRENGDAVRALESRRDPASMLG